ncbi:MAG: hypothetical protein HGA39_08695 [Coriobacteriia bacterium]|nr:hypothetical protein [Coriobacteriia bacterium]
MEAIHIRTEGLATDESALLVEGTVSRLSGVSRVVTVKSLKLTSVMYDERKINRRTILKAIRSVGFRARPYRAILPS